MSMYEQSLRHFLKPIHEYLDDPVVSEIMINGPEEIWVERKGKLTLTDARFTSEGIEAAARNMAQFVGRMLSEEQPRLDARLPDGSRIHVVMPPIARKGTTISIRKFFPDKLGMEELVGFGSMSPEMSRFIDACVALKENMVVSGGTGSGKTTLLNCVASFIPNEDRILTIEDSAELQLNQTHLVPFESRPADKLGKGKVDMGDLLHSALRLRPDRIVVGEVRGGEAFHLMQAMNTGHGGSLCTVHANTPTDTLRRIESLCLQSGVELPMVAVRAQVASAINIVICCARLQDGSRRTTHIAEVLPLDEKGDYRTQDIFVFTQTHKDEDGKIHGYHSPTGLLPTFIDKLASYGFGDLEPSFFDPATYELKPPPVFMVSEGVKMRWAPSLRHRQEGGADDEVDAIFAQQRALAEAAAAAAPAPKKAPEAPTPQAAPAPAPAPEAAPEPPTDEGAALAAPEPPTDEGAALATPEPPTDEGAALAAPEPQTDEGAALAAPEPQTDEGAALATPEPQTDEAAAAPPAPRIEVDPSLEAPAPEPSDGPASSPPGGTMSGRPRRRRGGPIGE